MQLGIEGNGILPHKLDETRRRCEGDGDSVRRGHIPHAGRKLAPLQGGAIDDRALPQLGSGLVERGALGNLRAYEGQDRRRRRVSQILDESGDRLLLHGIHAAHEHEADAARERKGVARRDDVCAFGRRFEDVEVEVYVAARGDVRLETFQNAFALEFVLADDEICRKQFSHAHKSIACPTLRCHRA